MVFVKQQRLNVDKLFRFCGSDLYNEISRQCGVHPGTVSNWVKNGGVPEQQADQVAIYLGVHPSAIWGDEWFNLAQQIAV